VPDVARAIALPLEAFRDVFLHVRIRDQVWVDEDVPKLVQLVVFWNPVAGVVDDLRAITVSALAPLARSHHQRLEDVRWNLSNLVAVGLVDRVHEHELRIARLAVHDLITQSFADVLVAIDI